MNNKVKTLAEQIRELEWRKRNNMTAISQKLEEIDQLEKDIEFLQEDNRDIEQTIDFYNGKAPSGRVAIRKRKRQNAEDAWKGASR